MNAGKWAPFQYSEKYPTPLTLHCRVKQTYNSLTCIITFITSFFKWESRLKVTSCFSIFFSLLITHLCFQSPDLPTNRNFCLTYCFTLGFEAFPPSAPAICQPPCLSTLSSPLPPHMPVRMLIAGCGSL